MTTYSAVHDTIVVERTYPATPARVFEAWRDPAIKRQWFTEGENWHIDEYELDLRPGGREYARFRFGDGDESINETAYVDVVPNHRIVMAYSMFVAGKRISVSLGTVEFLPSGRGTRLLYTEQAVFLDGLDGAESRRAGWQELLAALATSLERSVVQ